MYALVEIQGKQYKAQEGDVLKTERVPGNEGDVVEFDSVMMLQNDGQVTFGQPYVSGAKVKAVLENEGKNKKLVVYKYKRRKRYERKQGHRQPYSLLRVKEIVGA
jgi:large subunit ribosomal protein L21